jgi:HEPN domain-containing protein
VDRRELQLLASVRLREAKGLANLGFHDGAYYLAGYAVECALKARIAKATRKHDFPDKKKADASHRHNLRELLKVANLEEARLEQSKRDSVFRNNWDVVQSWSEESRYRINSAEDAQALVEAVSNRNHGVLQWIKQHW